MARFGAYYASARLLIALGMATLLFAGCESSSPGVAPRGRSKGSPAATATPGAGGSVSFGVLGEPATLDPHHPLASDLTYALARPLYRSLYRFDATGSAVPDLVESLEVAGDVATIELVEAEWSDGSAITSADVAATINDARSPSGLASIASVERKAPRRLVVSGRVRRWPEALARISFVMPRAGRRVFSGPFVRSSRTPGLGMALEPNPAFSDPPYLDRITIRYVEGLELLVALLEGGRLDAAWLPSTVNLGQRLAERDLPHQQSLGWERIILDLSGSDLTRTQRRDVAAALDRRAINRGFIRQDGRIANALTPQPGRGGGDGPFESVFRGRGAGDGIPLQLSAPSGDELLELIQRVAQVQLDAAGFDVELINVDVRRFYGAWAHDDPVDAALRRFGGAPGLRAGSARRHLTRLPLFQVDTVLAWRAAVAGLRVNPTLEGPLWNAHEWYLSEEQS